MVAFGAHGGPSPVEVMSVKNDSKLGKMVRNIKKKILSNRF